MSILYTKEGKEHFKVTSENNEKISFYVDKNAATFLIKISAINKKVVKIRIIKVTMKIKIILNVKL